MTENNEAKVGYVFNLTTGLSDTQQLVVSGNLALGASKEEMGREFDKLLAVTNRLSAKHRANCKKADIAQGETVVNAMKQDLAQLEVSKEGKQLSTVERANREAMISNIRRTEGKLEADRKALQETEKEAE